MGALRGAIAFALVFLHSRVEARAGGRGQRGSAAVVSLQLRQQAMLLFLETGLRRGIFLPPTP
jgi:hypothetical protein